jgi:hypothetical protein
MAVGGRAERVEVGFGQEAGDPLIEVALLLKVSGRPGCGPVGLKRGGLVASHLKEVAADGVEAAIRVDPGVGRQSLHQFEAVALHDPVAGEHFLGLGVGAVGHHRDPLLELDPPGVHRGAQAPGLDQLA